MKLQRTPLLVERTDTQLREAFRAAQRTRSTADILKLAALEYRATNGRGGYNYLDKVFGITTNGSFRLGFQFGDRLKYTGDLYEVIEARMNAPLPDSAFLLHIREKGGWSGPPVVSFAIEADIGDHSLSRRLSSDLAKVLNKAAHLKLSGKWVSDFSTQAPEFIGAIHPFDEKAVGFWKKHGQ